MEEVKKRIKVKGRPRHKEDRIFWGKCKSNHVRTVVTYEGDE